MKGKKYPINIRNQAKALMLVKPVEEIAKELEIPLGTLYFWKTQYEKDDDFKKAQEEIKLKVKLKMNESVDLALDIGIRKLKRAKENEEILDELIEEILSIPDEEMKYPAKQALIDKIKVIKVDDIRSLSTWIGTMRDKIMAIDNNSLLNLPTGDIQSIERSITVKMKTTSNAVIPSDTGVLSDDVD